MIFFFFYSMMQKQTNNIMVTVFFFLISEQIFLLQFKSFRANSSVCNLERQFQFSVMVTNRIHGQDTLDDILFKNRDGLRKSQGNLAEGIMIAHGE